jgi:putative ABC transport system permease protein
MPNLLKYALRNLAQKPVYSSITFTGFTIGIVSSLLIYLWISNELSYEKYFEGYNRIYRVLTLSYEGGKIEKSASSYRPLASSLKKDFPQIEYATFLSFNSETSPLQKELGGAKIEAMPCRTNSDFFNVFQGFQFIEGNPETAFSSPSGIVLNETLAHKLFGNAPALGKNVICDKYGKETYTVSAVIRIPTQTHLDFGYLVSDKNNKVKMFSNEWGDSYFVHVYIKLGKKAMIDDELINSLSNHLSRYRSINAKLMFQPITSIHLHSDYHWNKFDKNEGNNWYIIIFSALALLIIFMASLNFSFLSIARASERSTEIGIKKINGIHPRELIVQFLFESLFQTYLAAILAIIVVRIALPFFNTLTGQELGFNFSLSLVFNLFVLTTIVGVLAGTYPAFYLSAFKPAAIFGRLSNTGSGLAFTRIMTVIQFAIAIFFIISTIMFMKQLSYIRNKNLGFDDKNIVVVPTGLWYENKQFKEELMRNPKILGVSATVDAPVDFYWRTKFSFNQNGKKDSLVAGIMWTDEDFAKTYKLQVVKGQFLQMDYSAFWKESMKNYKKDTNTVYSYPIVINEAAEKALNIPDPIGTRIDNFVIVGVVKDFHFQPLKQAIQPLILTNDPQNIATMNIRIANTCKDATLKYIKNTYQKYHSVREFTYRYFDDLLDEKYHAEKRLKNISLMFAILGMIISVLGIWGMTYYSCLRRTKEIGIRKVNGARVTEILIMLNTDFIKWVAIAFVIACPIAWYAMHQWLQDFAYKTKLSWWVFAVAGVAAVAVALLTVSWQSWRAATMNPVESLRHE